MTDRSRREALVALAGIAGLAGCTGGPAGRASPSDGSPTATPTATPAGPEPVDPGEAATRWAVQFDQPVTAAPAVTDGAVVAGTGMAGIGTPSQDSDSTWSLAALDAADGTTRWAAGLPAPTAGTPVVEADGVYVQTGFSTGMTGTEQRLLKVAGGERRWIGAPARGFHHLLAVAGDGRAFVGTSDDAIGTEGQSMFAVDGDDGSRVWEVESGDAFGGRLVEGGLLANLGSVALELRDPADGRRLWRTEVGPLTEPDGTVPVVDGGVPVVAERDDGEAIGLVDLADGSVRWRFREEYATPFVPTGATALPEVTIGTQHDSLLVAAEYDGHVYGLSPLEGGVVWQFEAAEDVRDGPVADGERVYLVDFGGSVYALDARNGGELWRTTVGGHGGWLGVAGDTVVVDAGTEAERLVGLARDDGSTRWTFEAGANLTRPALGDGVVAVGSESGILRVLGG